MNVHQPLKLKLIRDGYDRHFNSNTWTPTHNAAIWFKTVDPGGETAKAMACDAPITPPATPTRLPLIMCTFCCTPSSTAFFSAVFNR